MRPDMHIFHVGRAFELAMAELWKEDNPGWRLSRGEVQYVTHEFGFPACATIDRRATKTRGPKRGSQRVVEMKIARNLEEWGDPDLDGITPRDYQLQVMSQQVFTGHRDPADLMVMGPFFKHHTYSIEFDEAVAEWMLGKCRWFYNSLAGDLPPDLDESLSTYKSVRELHPDINQGESVDIPESLAQDFLSAHYEAKVADRTLTGLKSKVLSQVGNAQYVTCNGETIAARQKAARGSVALVVKK
jgi:hypothetical protein